MSSKIFTSKSEDAENNNFSRNNFSVPLRNRLIAYKPEELCLPIKLYNNCLTNQNCNSMNLQYANGNQALNNGSYSLISTEAPLLTANSYSPAAPYFFSDLSNIYCQSQKFGCIQIPVYSRNEYHNPLEKALYPTFFNSNLSQPFFQGIASSSEIIKEDNNVRFLYSLSLSRNRLLNTSKCINEYLNNNNNQALQHNKPIITKELSQMLIIFENVTDFIENCNEQANYINSLKGSRLIQKLLDKDENKAFILFKSLESNLGLILLNVYGNYVCKKIFSLLNKSQRQVVWDSICKDLRIFAENQHANHSIQMLIAQSESDLEFDMIQLKLSHMFDYLAVDDHGIGILIALISKVNFQRKGVSIVKYIIDNLSDLAHNKNSVLLCKALVTKASKFNSSIKETFLSRIKFHTPTFLLEVNSSTLLIHMLQDWGLETCNSIVSMISSNFIIYSSHPTSFDVILKFLDVLVEFVSAA